MARNTPKAGKGRTGGRQTVTYRDSRGRTHNAVVVGGTQGTNEVQTVTITGTPTGGSFTLTYSGQTTAAIAFNASAADVQLALRNLSNIGDIDVTCTGGPFPGTAVVVTFRRQLNTTNVPQMTSTDSFTGGSSPASAVTTTTGGVAATLDLWIRGGGGGTRLLTAVARATTEKQTNVWYGRSSLGTYEDIHS